MTGKLFIPLFAVMLVCLCGCATAQKKTSEKTPEKTPATVADVCDFLKKSRVYYLATVDGDQPRVRPFGTAMLYEGKLYIQTGRKKNVSK